MDKQLANLKSGYQNFREIYFQKNTNKFKNLATGQNPSTLVVGCSDSRVDPAILMGCEPGDLFVVRNVANLVPPYQEKERKHHSTSAALEFGVRDLKVKNIIILGHSTCGGITSLFDNEEDKKKREFVSKWMDIAKDVKNDEKIKSKKIKSEKVELCSQLAIVQSLKNLMTFPWIKEKVENNELLLHGWYFNIQDGKIYAYDKEKDNFGEF